MESVSVTAKKIPRKDHPEKKRVSPRAVGQDTEVNFESRNPAAVVWRISPWEITETGKQKFF